MPARVSNGCIAGLLNLPIRPPLERSQQREDSMRFCLINPPWTFDASIYFGCREPHLPLEYGYSKALLDRAGHDVTIVDAQLDSLAFSEVRTRVEAFRPDFTVVTTAPSYLFWRCAPPELRVPRQLVDAVRSVAGTIVVVGPHASTTPGPALTKMEADVAVVGECEDILPELAGDWAAVDSIAWRGNGRITVQG